MIPPEDRRASNFLDDLCAAVRERGVAAVARDTLLSKTTIRRFLADPPSVRISTFSRLCRAVGMPHGPLHLIDMRTDKCLTCDGTRSEHYPLLPEAS